MRSVGVVFNAENGPRPATPTTAAANAADNVGLAFDDPADFERVARGFLTTRTDPQILDHTGAVVWDLAAFDFVGGQAPPTVNASLWRQAQLNCAHGLFQVSENVIAGNAMTRGRDLIQSQPRLHGYR